MGHAASRSSRDPHAHFEALLERARQESETVGLEKALDTYWEARNFAKAGRLGRCGEADMGIGVTLVDLDRVNEGLEAIRRACRFFTEDGRIFLRGSAHVALAEVALIKDDEQEATRHLELAEDLFRGTEQDMMAARAVKLRAEIRTRQGRTREAEALRERAQLLASAGRQPAALAPHAAA